MALQKALILEQAKLPFVLGAVPIPSPGPGEILVKVKASALNPVDWAIQTLGILVTSYPTILGRDIAGDVEQLGEGVQGFSKGDRVYVHRVFKTSMNSESSLLPIDSSNLSFSVVSTVGFSNTLWYLPIVSERSVSLLFFRDIL